MQEWRRKNPIRNAWFELRNKCRRKCRHLGLTYEQFEEFCKATGYTDGSGRQRYQLHIDRIDPSKGYEIGNIQILTCSENTAKGNRERYHQGERPF